MIAPYAIAALACVTAVLVWRHLGGRRHPVAIAMCLAVLVTLTFFEVRFRVREHHWTDVARHLVGRGDVTVHCQRILGYSIDVSGRLGYVPYPADGSPPTDAYLRHDTCSDLAGYLGHRTDPTSAQVRAVHVLTHESMHLRGITNEAEAECAAMQRDTRTAELLGADPADARALAHTYHTDDYPYMPAEYQSDECRPGGEMDEHLPDPPWAGVRADAAGAS